MKNKSAEIDLRIPNDGDLVIPAEALKRLNVGPKNRVHIRIIGYTVSGQLKRRNVTEEEIEHIAALQLEPKENVVKFLSTEGGLSANKSFVRRAQVLRGRF